MEGYLLKFLLFTLLSELLRPDVKAQRPASAGLKDLSFPTADPTRPLPWLIGKYMIDAPNLFCTYDFKPVERSKKVRNGFFGLSSTELPLPTEYYISAGMTLCGGTGVKLREIWIDDVKVWTGNASDGASIYIDYSVAENGNADYPAGFRGYVNFHSGSTAPNTYLANKRGAGNTPAFSHLTYVVLRGANTTGLSLAGSPTVVTNGAWIGTSTQVKPLKFVCERMPTAATTGLGAHPDGGNYFTVGEDANPVYAIAEAMLNSEYCAGIAADELIASSFHAAAKKCYLEGHGTSQLWDNQRSTGEVVFEICKQIGAVLQSDPATGAHVMKLLRGDDPVVYTFNDSNIKELQSFGRNAMDESTNALTLSYVDKEAGWEKRSLEAQDLAAIEVAGQVITGTGSYAGITNAALCASIAQRDLRAISAPLANSRFTAIVEKRLKFRPGDLVNFSSERNGVSSVNMRITSSRYSKPGEALCEIEAVEDVFTAGEAIYSTPAPIANSPTAPPTLSSYGKLIGIAPSALTADSNNHVIAAYAARDASQSQVDIGFDDGAGTSIDALAYADGVRTYPVCTGARLLNPVAWNQKTAIDIILDEPGMAVLKANLGRFNYGVLAVMNITWPETNVYLFDSREEYVTVSGVSITGPLTASITLSKRGMFDTYPLGYGTTKGIFFLFGSVVDPMPLKTATSTEGPAYSRYYYTQLDGAAYSTPVARFRNIAGTSQATSTTVNAYLQNYQNPSFPVPLEPRALLPAHPAKVQFAGQFGAKDLTDTAPIISISGKTKLLFTWVDRGAGLGTADWFTAATEASTNKVGWVLETNSNRQEESASNVGWTRVNSGSSWSTLEAGIQQLEVSVGPGTPLFAGQYVRFRVFTYKEIIAATGNVALFPLNFYDDQNKTGQQHSFVWQIGS